MFEKSLSPSVFEHIFLKFIISAVISMCAINKLNSWHCPRPNGCQVTITGLFGSQWTSPSSLARSSLLQWWSRSKMVRPIFYHGPVLSDGPKHGRVNIWMLIKNKKKRRQLDPVWIQEGTGLMQSYLPVYTIRKFPTSCTIFLEGKSLFTQQSVTCSNMMLKAPARFLFFKYWHYLSYLLSIVIFMASTFL